MTIMQPEAEERTVLDETDGHERDRMAHYFRKDDIIKSQIDGVPVIALCGKKTIPYRDPEKYPVCPTCKEIWESLSDD